MAELRAMPRYIQDAIAILRDGNEPSLFEPAKSKRQLPQVVSGVADWKLSGPPQDVCGLPSNRRLCCLCLLLTHRDPIHTTPTKIPRRSPVYPASDSTSSFGKTAERWNGWPRNESNMASGSSPQSPTGRKPLRGLTAPASNRLEPFKGCLDGGMTLHFSRVAPATEELEIWSASESGFSFVISNESRSGPGLHGQPGFVAS